MNIRFSKLRRERFETIQDLANATFIDRSTLSRIENGAREVSKSHIEPLCHIFQVTSDYLLERSDMGILCKNSLNNMIELNEEEFNNPSISRYIYTNHIEGRCITKDGEVILSELRSKSFDQNMMFVMQSLTSNSLVKDIIPLLSKLNNYQLEIILNTIKAFIGK